MPSSGAASASRLRRFTSARSEAVSVPRAPEHASVILAPPSGSTLDASVVFEVSESTASARWIVVRDAHSLLAVQPIAGRVVRVDGLPTDGRALIAQVYSLGPDGWVSTTAAYRAR